MAAPWFKFYVLVLFVSGVTFGHVGPAIADTKDASVKAKKTDAGVKVAAETPPAKAPVEKPRFIGPHPTLSGRNPRCEGPVKPEPTVEPAKGGPWLIHAGGVGNIPPDGPFPKSVLDLEGKTYEQLVIDPIKGKDHYDAMAQGHFDMEGFRTLKLSKVDLVMRIARNKRVMCLYPGPSLRTAQGTGIGSTLGNLVAAHGGYTMNRIPEPYHCAVSVPGLPTVSFYFTTCKAACDGEPVKKIYFPGFDAWGKGGKK